MANLDQIDAAVEKEYETAFDDTGGSEPVPPADIVAYNELRSCADLFRIYETGKLEIQPDFQREVVWEEENQTRFIDSLVKQLPIPSMCFSLDYKTQRWKVIDGLQRMTSIIKFLGRPRWKLSDIDDVHASLRGATNVELREGNDEESSVYAAVQNMSVPITVIRCDYTKPGHMDYLFTIFHRLNSGSVRLNNQEIRNCIYSGRFNDTIKKFDSTNKDWRDVKKRIWGKMDRFRSVEVLLRILAFSDEFPSYDGNLARFLNRYMAGQQKLSENEAVLLSEKLSQMASAGAKALKGVEAKKISLTQIEALLVGLLKNPEEAAAASGKALSKQFVAMVADSSFATAARFAVAGEKNVKTRIAFAISAFR